MSAFQRIDGLVPGFTSPSWNQAAPFGDAGLGFYAIADAHKGRPAHFHLCHDGRILLQIACTLGEDLSCYRWPLLPAVADGVPDDLAEAALDCALDHVLALAAATPSGMARVQGACPMLAEPAPTPVDRACARRGGIARPHLHAVADLSQTPEALRHDLRKSFRSLVNWGGRNFQLRTMGKADWDDGLWAEFVAFYTQISGHPRPPAFWQAFAHAITHGPGGEVMMGRLEDSWRAAAVVLDGQCVASYALAAYDRGHFDKPLGHFPLFQAMTNARARGLRWFDFGEIFAEGGAPAKEVSISLFKTGFTSRRVSSQEWMVRR